MFKTESKNAIELLVRKEGVLDFPENEVNTESATKIQAVARMRAAKHKKVGLEVEKLCVDPEKFAIAERTAVKLQYCFRKSLKKRAESLETVKASEQEMADFFDRIVNIVIRAFKEAEIRAFKTAEDNNAAAEDESPTILGSYVEHGAVAEEDGLSILGNVSTEGPVE